MNKRDKAHGTIISKAVYIEDLVSSHFGLKGEPQFHHPLFEGLIAIGIATDKVYIYVKDIITEKLVLKELDAEFQPDEKECIKVLVVGNITPA